MRLIIVSIMCLILSANLLAQKTFKTADEANRAADEINNYFAKGEDQGAIKMLNSMIFPKNTALAKKLKTLATAVKENQKVMGKALGTDMVREQKGGKSLVRYSYIIKYLEAPFIIHYTYYNAGKGYVLIDVEHSTDLEGVFE